MKLEEISLSDIYEFVTTGKVQENVDPAIPKYLHLLDKARSMHLRIDEFGHKDAIVNHFVNVEGLSRYLATNIYNDAIEYFYADNQISKDAWRNIIAQDMRKNYILAIQLAKDTKDVSSANKILLELAKTLRLDQPDPIEPDEHDYLPPFKMYTMDAAALGMPKIDRRVLAKQIDSYPELSEKERTRLKQEAAILPIKLFLETHEDPRKS
jgi:hypothetical protein